MTDIEVVLKDGTTRDFPHEGRLGGSYTKSIRYEGAFAIITDEWYREVAIPADSIVEVKVTPTRW